MTTNNAVNAPFPLSTTLGGLGVASPTAHGILVGEGSSAVTPIVLTTGQLLIGTTSGDPAGATLTQGAGITITNASGGITISSSASGYSWSTVITSTKAIVAQNAYVADYTIGTLAFTLPATGVLGDTFIIKGLGSGGWSIATNAGQSIIIGNQTASTSLASTNQYDTVAISCIVTTTTWSVDYSMGNITYV